MVLKPTIEDIKIIGYYLSRIIVGLSFAMIFPAIIGIIFGEEDAALDFLIAAAITMIFTSILGRICRTRKDLDWMHGMVVISVSWLAAMALNAIPLYASGHYMSFLDACFETMSGLTTTGLSLVQDLDHLSHAHNLWRHLGPFIGGQGIAIIALTFFIKGTAGAFRIYVGEARDERLLPNVIHTARFIWKVSFVYLTLGTLILGIAGISLGLSPMSSFFHAVCLFMAGFDTAGFAPQSQNILYYHSVAFEAITIVFMILGTFNFNLHYQIWIGNFKELYKNIEVRAFFISMTLVFLVVAVLLSYSGIYSGAIIIFRKIFYHIASAHTTTGYMTIYAKQFITDWGGLGMLMVICAMALGGCICSTAGGIKMLRIGIIFKAFWQDVKRITQPKDAIISQKFHHIKDIVLSDQQARAAIMITVSYIVLYLFGTIAGMILGYPLLDSLFESTSAAANVGLSCGVTDVSMPAALKMVYIIQMWMGRLEFMSVFALAGFFIAALKGKR